MNAYKFRSLGILYLEATVLKAFPSTLLLKKGGVLYLKISVGNKIIIIIVFKFFHYNILSIPIDLIVKKKLT